MGKIKKLLFRNDGAAMDSILLTFVKVITAVLGIVVSKLLAMHFSLHEFGTYSEAMLIATTASSIAIFGLTNAVNYFYNAASSEERKEEYIGTIFTMEYILGTVCAIVIMAIQVPIINYFDDADLKDILFFVAWLPLFQNLIPMLQVLFVSIGRAKLIAARNFFFSAARLIIVLIACFVTKSIITIFIILLFLDIAQAVYFIWEFSRKKYKISVKFFRASLIKPILSFSIPMAVYVLSNVMSRDIDKYVISFFTDTETLAIYANAAKILPFDLVTQSFITVLIPIVTRQIAAKDYTNAQKTFKDYLRLGYLATWLIVFSVIINAKEAMLILYDPKYLPGLAVFIIYLIVDMVTFATTPLILVSKGKSKILMLCTLGALTANLVLNVITFQFWGIIGPAISTLVATLGLAVTLLLIDGKMIKTSLLKLFDWKEMCIVLLEIILVGGAAYALKQFLYRFFDSPVLIVVITASVYFAGVLVLNRKRLISCFKQINKAK